MVVAAENPYSKLLVVAELVVLEQTILELLPEVVDYPFLLLVTLFL